MSYTERADRFDADLAAAAAAVDSDSQLIALLGRPQIDDRERILITAALGESGTGPDGSAAARAQFSDAMARLATVTKSARPGWRDLACAAVIALARRDGPAATDIYLTAAGCTSADVRDYGLMVLAAEGDERAWSGCRPVAPLRGAQSPVTIHACDWPRSQRPTGPVPAERVRGPDQAVQKNPLT